VSERPPSLLEAVRWSDTEGETFPNDLEGVAGMLAKAGHRSTAKYLRQKARDLRSAICAATQEETMAKYPKQIFVKEMSDGGEPYLNAGKSASDLAEMGEKAKVGVYQLVKTIEVEGVAQIKDA
jgi:hypothetical protein